MDEVKVERKRECVRVTLGWAKTITIGMPQYSNVKAEGQRYETWDIEPGISTEELERFTRERMDALKAFVRAEMEDVQAMLPGARKNGEPKPPTVELMPVPAGPTVRCAHCGESYVESVSETAAALHATALCIAERPQPSPTGDVTKTEQP